MDITGEAPITATLMQAMIAFNWAVEDVDPLSSLFDEVSQLQRADLAAFIALILDTAQQADEIFDNAALGDYWLLADDSRLHDAKTGIEHYGEALQRIVNLFNADSD